jgi:single-stranded-DNA-specific exonuclease
MTPTIPNPDEFQKILLDRLNFSEKEQKDFLFPEYKLGELSLFEDMDLAVKRIYKAIKSGEQIGIYSDYDCDGIPGAVVLLDLFKELKYTDNLHIYIPDRHDEGYGLSKLGIDELEKKNVSLIITVDLGITAIAEVADARSHDIDIIITDHHQPLSEYPASSSPPKKHLSKPRPVWRRYGFLSCLRIFGKT